MWMESGGDYPRAARGSTCPGPKDLPASRSSRGDRARRAAAMPDPLTCPLPAAGGHGERRRAMLPESMTRRPVTRTISHGSPSPPRAEPSPRSRSPSPPPAPPAPGGPEIRFGRNVASAVLSAAATSGVESVLRSPPPTPLGDEEDFSARSLFPRERGPSPASCCSTTRSGGGTG